MKSLSEARVAIVNEWLVQYTGSERILPVMLSILPRADLYATVHDPKRLRDTPLEDLPVRSSFLQSLPGSKKRYSSFLPLMPLAVERFDLSTYDIVISNSHAVAKGAITSPDQLHVCYLHARNLKYAYEDRFYYPRNAVSGLLQDSLLSWLRVWDGMASTRPDVTVANSRYVSEWHLRRHGVRSRVVYPPVDTEYFSGYFRDSGADKGDYYVTVGRLEPYKRPDLIVEAFNRLGMRLLVVGGGSMLGPLKRIAAPNVEFLGTCDGATVAQTISGAKAFVFAAREEFGIAPLEAQACGTPVVALGKGGTLETTVGWPSPGATGVLFDAQTPEALQNAVKLFEAHEDEFDPEACSRNAGRFGQRRFQEEFATMMEDLWDRFRCGEALETV